MADQYILGIDVGGTKTHALGTTFDGKIVSVTSGEGANWENIGLEKAVSSVHTIALEALHSSSLTFSDILQSSQRYFHLLLYILLTSYNTFLSY